MKSIRKNGFKGIAVAAALSMTMTTMVSPAATAIPTGRWEQSMQTGVWKYRNVTGEYLADQWFLYEGKWYRFDKDGNMITGWYQNPETKDWYYLWENGSMATGWVPVNGRWYYLNAGSGEMAHDVTTPDGYKVNADGAWVDANGKAYDAPNGDQKTTTSKRNSGGSGGSSDSDSDSGSHSSGNNSSNSGNSGNNGGNSSSNGSNSGNNGTAGDNGSNGGNNEIAGDNGSNGGNNGNAGDNGSNSGNNGNAGDNGSNSGNNGTAGDNGSNGGNNGNAGDNGSNSGNNGNAGDNGNNSGNNGNTGDNETPEEKTLVVESQTKLVDLGWSQYVTVAFAKGYSLDDCTLTVDGVDVTDAFTKVDKDGTIAKWEITSLNPAKLAVTGKDGETQIVKLSNNANPETPVVRTATAPKAFLAHGSVYVWDYHLDNYDEDGNIRYTPKETTFDFGEEKGGIRYYAPAAELTEDESKPYGVSGEAVVMFNYTEEADKQWFDQITNVALVSGNGYNNTINSNLEYDKTTGEHYGNTVGQIIVPLGQSNFYSNGSYYLRITSGGKNTLIPIEVVNGTAPSMRLNEATEITSGMNIHFEVSNMTYGIEIPISRVELTDPDGETTELEKIRDWYLIGNTFILYNDVTAENGRNNIPKTGSYTVTVHSTGFKDMTYTFSVVDNAAAQNEVVAEDIYGIDAMSSASISGGSVSGSGDASGGGSTTMSADLLFDADLLTNALLLKRIGVENEYANAIADRWTYDMSGHDAVIGEDGETFYTFTGYRDAVEKAKGAGKYLSFADYIESENADTTPNRPYATKYVLEDNRLGGTMMSGSYLGKTAPKFVLIDKEGNAVNEIPEGQDVRIVCDDAEYLRKIVDSGEIYMNGITYQAVNKNEYWLEEVGEKQVLVLRSSLFGVDKDNKVTIKVDKYQDKIFNVAIAKDVKAVELTVGGDLETGKEVTITNTADETGDIWKNIQSVVLVKPDKTTKKLLPDGQGSVYEKIGYTINDDTLTLGKDLFDVAGEYSVQISAKYYGTKTVTFTVEQAEDNNGGDNTDEKLAPPTELPTVTVTMDYWDGLYTLNFGSKYGAWAEKITGVRVNNTEYEKNSYIGKDKTRYAVSTTDAIIRVGNGSFVDGNNEIVISAEGYEDLIIIVDNDGNIITDDTGNGSGDNGAGKDDNNNNNDDKLTPPQDNLSGKTDSWGDFKFSFGSDIDEWIEKITSVAVNGKAYTKGYVNHNTQYSINWDNSISMGNAEFTTARNEVIISANGYVDLRFYVDKTGTILDENAGEVTEPEKNLPEGDPRVSVYGSTCSMTFGSDNEEWSRAITAVTVNGVPFNTGYSTPYYNVSTLNASITICGFTFEDGKINIVISADGYDNLEITIDENGAIVKNSESQSADDEMNNIVVIDEKVDDELVDSDTVKVSDEETNSSFDDENAAEIDSNIIADINSNDENEILNNEEEIIEDTETEESTEIEESEETVEIEEDASVEFVLDEAPEL